MFFHCLEYNKNILIFQLREPLEGAILKESGHTLSGCSQSACAPNANEMRRFIFPASSRHIWITEISRFIYLFIHQKMVENPRVTDEQNGSVITEDEAALYDRQIRLWGLDAQKRLEISNVSSCRQDSFKHIFESFCTVCWWKFRAKLC